jgi:adenylate cyclase
MHEKSTEQLTATRRTRVQPRALLCTDLEGFTATVQRLGDAGGRELIRCHNRMLRACLARFRGREVAHTGDGIFACFHLIGDALDCAVSMQRELRAFNASHTEAPLKIRIGMHVGNPLPEEGRLFGSCVNITARVCHLTQAESIYVSDSFRSQVADCHCHMIELGSFALKGIDNPLRIYELAWR